jgi:hypothetical protein
MGDIDMALNGGALDINGGMRNITKWLYFGDARYAHKHRGLASLARHCSGAVYRVVNGTKRSCSSLALALSRIVFSAYGQHL